jgi:methyl-accepting chemotaxis protein
LTEIFDSQWLTVSQVAKETGVDVQRVRRMVDNDLVGNKDSKTNVRFIRTDEIETVKMIAEFMDSTPNSTYEQAKEILLKDELLEKHKREEEIKTTEVAFQNTIIQVLPTIIETVTENITDRVTDRVLDRMEDRFTAIEKRLSEAMITFQKQMSEGITGHQRVIEAGRYEDQEKANQLQETLKQHAASLEQISQATGQKDKRIGEQKETLEKQAEALDKLTTQVMENLREEKQKQQLIEKQQEILEKQAEAITKLSQQVEELKEQPKRKKLFGLF